MPERKIVSPADLNTWLTSEIRKIDGCHKCELTWKYRLRYPELHDGCNWSELNLRLGPDTDLQVAVKAAAEIEVRAFEQFNLEDAPPPLPPTPVAQFQVTMERRMLYLPVFHLDANLINAKPEAGRREPA